MKITKALEKKVRDGMKEARKYRDGINDRFYIHHYGEDYKVVWTAELDEKGNCLVFTDNANLYRKCETDIRDTYIATFKADGTIVVDSTIIFE